MPRYPNHRLAKIHRNYTVEEVARRWRVHRNTVRQWIKRGLPTIDQRRPLLIHGGDLAEFLAERRRRNRRPCAPGEIFCVRCRVPQIPAGGLADYEPLTVTRGNLVGICPSCDCLIFRSVNRSRLEQVRGVLDVHEPKGLPHIVERVRPSVNSDFGREG